MLASSAPMPHVLPNDIARSADRRTLRSSTGIFCRDMIDRDRRSFPAPVSRPDVLQQVVPGVQIIWLATGLLHTSLGAAEVHPRFRHWSNEGLSIVVARWSRLLFFGGPQHNTYENGTHLSTVELSVM